MAVPNVRLMISIMVAAAMVVDPVEALGNEPPSTPVIMWVRIQNNLPGNLNVHCFSADDDLRLHPMPPGAQYKWTFELNLWGTTLFHCRFNFVGTRMWQAFKVWNGPGLSGLKFWPCQQCVWVVNQDGFFRAQEGKPLIIIHPWRQDPENFLTP